MTNPDQGPMGPADLIALANERAAALVADATDERTTRIVAAKAAKEARVALAQERADARHTAAKEAASSRISRAQRLVDRAQEAVGELEQQRSTGDLADLTARANRAFSRVKVATSQLRGAKEPVIMAVPEDAYGQVLRNMTSEPDPYRLVYLNAYDHNGRVLINTVWVERGYDDVAAVPEWQAFYGLSSDEFQTELDELTRQGMRPIQVHTYLRNGEVRYAPVFVTDTTGGRWLLECDQTVEEAHDSYAVLVAREYRIATQSVDYRDGQAWVTTLYDRPVLLGLGSECVAVDSDEFQQFCTNAEVESHGMTYLDVKVDPEGVPRFTAEWRERSYRPGSLVYHDLDEAAYHEQYQRRAANGYVVSLIATYEVNEKLRYAVVFTVPPGESIAPTDDPHSDDPHSDDPHSGDPHSDDPDTDDSSGEEESRDEEPDGAQPYPSRADNSEERESEEGESHGNDPYADDYAHDESYERDARDEEGY